MYGGGGGGGGGGGPEWVHGDQAEVVASIIVLC